MDTCMHAIYAHTHCHAMRICVHADIQPPHLAIQPTSQPSIQARKCNVRRKLVTRQASITKQQPDRQTTTFTRIYCTRVTVLLVINDNLHVDKLCCMRGTSYPHGGGKKTKTKNLNANDRREFCKCFPSKDLLENQSKHPSQTSKLESEFNNPTNSQSHYYVANIVLLQKNKIKIKTKSECLSSSHEMHTYIHTLGKNEIR